MTVARSRSDDERAFGELFDEHRPAVFAYLVGRVSDRDWAGDLLQDVFLRAWRRLDEIRDLPVERQRAWIFTVAKNLVTDAYRARATREATMSTLRQTAETATPDRDGPASRVETVERVSAVASAVRQLPDDLRVVITMSAVGELTSAQIGEALGQPAGTVRYKLSVARRRLAELLDTHTPTAVEAR